MDQDGNIAFELIMERDELKKRLDGHSTKLVLPGVEVFMYCNVCHYSD
jgi:hypothetical protein